MQYMPTEVTAALLGAILGGFIAFLPALYVLRRQEKYKVYAELVAAFTEDIRLLKIQHPMHSQEYKPVAQLLEERYPSHHLLVLRASFQLGCKGDEIVKSFHSLITFDPEHQMPTFTDYKVGTDHDKEREARARAVDRISQLLQRAKVE